MMHDVDIDLIAYWSTHKVPDPEDHYEIGIDENGRTIYGRRET